MLDSEEIEIALWRLPPEPRVRRDFESAPRQPQQQLRSPKAATRGRHVGPRAH